MAGEASKIAPQLDSKAENFKEFCGLMTAFAENQLDLHRSQYYRLSVTYLYLTFVLERSLQSHNDVLRAASLD